MTCFIIYRHARDYYIYRKIEYGHDELYLLAAALALNVITVTRFVIIEHLCEK